MSDSILGSLVFKTKQATYVAEQSMLYETEIIKIMTLTGRTDAQVCGFILFQHGRNALSLLETVRWVREKVEYSLAFPLDWESIAQETTIGADDGGV